MINTIRVVCDEHSGPRPAPWVIATFEVIDVPSKGVHEWRPAHRSENQVRGLIRRRDAEGRIPEPTDSSQARAREFLRRMPETYPGGGKPTSNYQLLGSHRLDEGIPIEAIGSTPIETRHRLTCPKCQSSNVRKAKNLQLSVDSLGKLLDQVANAGLHEITIASLAKMNGRSQP